MLRDYLRKRMKSKRGMTLLEVIVGLAIFSVMISSILLAYSAGLNDMATAQELSKNSEVVKNFIATLSNTGNTDVSVYLVENYSARILDEYGNETLMTIEGKCLIAKNRDGRIVKYMKLTNEQIRELEGWDSSAEGGA